MNGAGCSRLGSGRWSGLCAEAPQRPDKDPAALAFPAALGYPFRTMTDPKLEALLGPERPADPAEERRLERQVEEEDFALRQKLAGQFVPVALFLLFVLSIPLGRLFRQLPSLAITGLWAALNVPLLVLVYLAFRRDRLPAGSGRFVTGRRARRLALGLLAANLFLFFGRAWLQALWEWVEPAGW
jgi:hypothetical protein